MVSCHLTEKTGRVGGRQGPTYASKVWGRDTEVNKSLHPKELTVVWAKAIAVATPMDGLERALPQAWSV